MTATSHAVLGTVIAAKIGNPALAVPIAIISHLAADAIPHWDVATHRGKKDIKKLILDLFLDVLLSFALSFVLLSLLFPKTNLSYAFLIIIASQLLDWLTGPYYLFDYLFNIHPPPFSWFYRLQKKFDHQLDKPWGIITQVGVIILVLILAKIF